jgi:hypothetical protein
MTKEASECVCAPAPSLMASSIGKPEERDRLLEASAASAAALALWVRLMEYLSCGYVAVK